MSTSTATVNSRTVHYNLTPIEIQGESYEVEAATIYEAYMGYENHGLLIANLYFAAPSWGQREPAYNRSAEALDHYLRGVLTVTRASDWSKVVNTPVLALRKSFMGPIEGFASPDQKRILLFNGGHRSEVILRD